MSAEGAADGQLARRLPALDAALDALKTALGPAWTKTAVVMATEFGRTVHPNGNGGTDHGTGGAAFLSRRRGRGRHRSGRNGSVSSRPRCKDGRDQPARTDLRALFKGVLAGAYGRVERRAAVHGLPRWRHSAAQGADPGLELSHRNPAHYSRRAGNQVFNATVHFPTGVRPCARHNFPLPQRLQRRIVFAVSGIHVDASAPSASVAQLAAIAQGRPRAWNISTSESRLPRTRRASRGSTTLTLQRIIRGFTVKNEKRSTTRYVADVTYIFSPEAVQRVLQTGGIAFTQVQARRILLVPFAPNYSGGSMWTAAFSGTRYSTSSIPFAFRTAPWISPRSAPCRLRRRVRNDIEPAASRIRSTEAVLMVAGPNW